MKFTLPSGLIGMMILLLFTGYIARGQQSTNFTPLNFIENKGQWDPQVLYKSDVGTADIWLRKTGFTFMLYSKEDMHDLYESMHGHGEARDSGIIYVPKNSTAGKSAITAVNGEKPPPRPAMPNVRGHAYQVNFIGANENPEIIPEKAQESTTNYFIGNDKSKWASGVKSYQGLVYKSIYPGIDAHVYSDASQLKYDLIVAAGANPDKIQLSYEGATGMEIKKGQLLVHTTVGDVIEQLPYAYQYVNNQRVTVKVSYRLNGNKVGFKISGDYDPAYPLVIDPVYVFSTVSGSRADNWGFTATYDDAGNFYGGGIVFNNGYPATPGAYKTAFNGGTFDIAISKFNPNGTRLIYATYIGGSGQEQPHSLFVDKQGNLVISGRTNSGDYPYDKVEGKQGGWDIVVTKLNATGSGLIGSLVIGGSADDGVNMRENRTAGDWVLLRNYGDDARSEVVIDDAGYIYVAGCTRSSDFPVVGTVFQPTFGGLQDGVVMKINPMCQGLVWSSFLGGSSEDAAYVIALNKLNTLYVAGGTASSNFTVTPGAIYPAYRGGVCDGFITHIANDGSKILQSTFLGSDDPSADQVYGIQLDKNGFLYAMGTTEGTWPIKLLNPGDYNDNSLQYIVKLQPDLSAFVYSTTFGRRRQLAPTPSISPTAFLVDRCENVYVSGWGGGINNSLHYPNSGTFGLPAKNPIQSSTDGMDFYFFVLQRDATAQLFGSWFGGNGLYEHVDGGTSRFDRNGVIYQGICAWCNVSNSGAKPRYPTTPGAYSSTPPPSCNYGALKIAFNLDGVRAGAKTLSRRSNFCVPSDITFVDTTRIPAQSYKWDFGDGSPVVQGPKLDTVTHTFTKLGTYTVMLVKFDNASCNGSDTAYVVVKLGDNEAKFDFDAIRQQPCQDLAYIFTSNATPAGAFHKDSSFIFDLGDGTKPQYVGPSKFPTPIHKFPGPGIYNVSLTLVDTNFCNAPQTITKPLRVAAEVTAKFVMPDTVCVGTEQQMDNTTLGGESFLWTFKLGNDSTTSTEPYPIFKFDKSGIWTVKLVAVDNNTCNKKDSVIKSVLVADPPEADFDFMPTKATENTPVTFTNLTKEFGQPMHYLWNFGDGDTTSVPSPQHQYLKTGTYNVCLTAANQEGCTETVCKTVSAIVVPLFDVPSAFSPNNDGMNDVFYVKSFGVTKFNLKIFNRWGQLIFESTNPNMGWDGRFKGAIQPMDAYAYVVTLEFTDGTKANKTGNVTLLR
ncbi:PKD domain-containing protein [Chitinophaga qingshengii]|uniref:PKD domain-containing protein n=1 Tax=Chitinophaga qingshengii TaxID=1569794 RepID=A0ABR7TNW2_9BACT|nr:PKD domain-containing protein [Chitinophaga qingshengii]MBC9930714.1 PKD domain-containing protein [Chitinophaga qingshengii]